MTKHKAYKYRIYPTTEQKQMFSKTFGSSRFIWNKMLSDKKEHYDKTKENLMTTPAQYKAEFPWLKEVDSLALANVQLQLQKAYKSFFQAGFGFPKFKKKFEKQSYTTNNQKGSVRLEEGKIKLPKIGWVKIKQHRPLVGVIKSATVSMSPTGKYMVSILCETQILELPKMNKRTGIDLGLTDFAILSSGEKFENNRFLQKLSKKLAKEQKKLSRRALNAKKEGRNLSESKNYQKQRLVVAKIHEQIANQRNDYLNKVSTQIIKNHDVVCVEDLSSKNLMKNHKLAKAIGDVSWHTFVSKLQYKADWYGKPSINFDKSSAI
ncbi:MAG: transposase, partial [Streptococcaceae bacterium]|nr:transposase [Streptococcaceae bacterium]